jgi:hypothetical protein
MSGITLQPPAPAIRIPELRSGMKLVGIQRDELLFPSSSVTVEMPTAMDAEAAQRAIGVAREDNAVKVGTQGKKATWSPSDALLPGRHVFQVGPLLSKSGEEIAPEVAIPFQFVQTAAKVPRDVAVEAWCVSESRRTAPSASLSTCRRAASTSRS